MAGKALSPFDEAKYKALLEGLEAVELLKSEVLEDNETFRFDSEFFKKEYFQFENKLKTKELGEFSLFIKKGLFNMSPLYYQKKGVPFIRVSNCNNLFINKSNLVFLSEKIHKQNSKFELNKYDFVMSKIGTIGEVSINMDYEKVNYSQNNIGIKIDKTKINPLFLIVFINSFFAKKQIERSSQGQVQQKLILDNIKQLKVPILSAAFQLQIEKLVKQAHHKLDSSKTLYQEAEAMLLEAVGLQDFKPSQEKVNAKTFSESFGKSGRLDAEYYQPKYEEVEKILKAKGFSLLKNICSDINYGTVPTSPYTEDGSGIPYIKGLNLKNTEISKTKLDRITNTQDLQDRYYTKRGDIIISQMGTVGDVGVIRDEENWLFASFTIRARLKNFTMFNPYFIGLYIQNVAKKYYLYRNIAQASVRQNTDLPTIRNLYIPNIQIEKQEAIAEKIEKSFTLKKESERLLEVAKQAVEVAIEQGEEKGLAIANSINF